MATKPVTFSALPTDVQTLILSFVVRPRDLASLCLVSRHIRQVAVRHLYRKVTLDIGGPTDGKLSALLNPQNPGLKHMRVLNIYHSPERSCGRAQQAVLSLKMLLEFLPHDCLEQFRWHPWDVFSTTNLELLYRTQRKLELLEAVTLDRAFGPSLRRRLDFDSVVGDNVHTLGLYPDSKDALEFSHELLQRKSELQKLTIGSNFNTNRSGDAAIDDDDEDEDDEDDDDDDGDDDDDEGSQTDLSNDRAMTDWDDTATRPGRLAATLFRHLLPFDNCTPMLVQDLTLEKIYLRYSRDTYCRTIDMPHLKHLRIIDCPAVGAFFATLCGSRFLPTNLETLELTHSDDSAEKELIHAIDEFLPLVSGLKRLALEIGGTSGLPNVSGIVRHGKTLRVLSLHASDTRITPSALSSLGAMPNDELSYSKDDFQAICRACSQIRQLSVAFPRTSISGRISRSYTRYFDVIEQYLHHLVTLQISTWPNNQPNSSSGRLNRKNYVHMLQSMAQNIFERDQLGDFWVPPLGAAASMAPDDFLVPLSANLPSRPSGRLRLVAWGTSDLDYDRTERTQMAIFAAGYAVNPLNNSRKVHATLIGWNERRWWEPESEVLDWALQRGVRGPWIPLELEESDDIIAF